MPRYGRSAARGGVCTVALALAAFGAWTGATFLLEGNLRTLLRPDAAGLRVAYMLVANYAVGIGLGTVVIRRIRGRPERAGFSHGRRALAAAAVGSLLGLGVYLALGGATTHPIVLANLYAQVLGVSAAEIVVCWAGVGAAMEQVLQTRGRIASLAVGIIGASVTFGVYHFAHSPPFNGVRMVAFLTAIGLATGIFFFVSRDVYGTIAFHNWLGVIGVSQSLEAVGELQGYEQLRAPLLATGALGVALLVLMHWKLVGGSSDGPAVGRTLR